MTTPGKFTCCLVVCRLCAVALTIASIVFEMQCARAEPRLSRHIYVIYDVSLSYHYDQNLSWEDDRVEMLDEIKDIGESITYDDYFSFLPMNGWVRDPDCTNDLSPIVPFEKFGGHVAMYDGEEEGAGLTAWRTAWSQTFAMFEDFDWRMRDTDWTQNTDLLGALHRASRIFKSYPAGENYLVIFSDLDDDPLVPGSAKGLCSSLDLRGIQTILVDFGFELSDYVKHKNKRPTGAARLEWFAKLLHDSHAPPFERLSRDDCLLCRLGLESRSGVGR